MSIKVHRVVGTLDSPAAVCMPPLTQAYRKLLAQRNITEAQLIADGDVWASYAANKLSSFLASFGLLWIGMYSNIPGAAGLTPGRYKTPSSLNTYLDIQR